MKKVIKEIQHGDVAVYRAKQELEAVNKAHATTRFVHSILAGLRGEQNVAEIAYTRTVLMPGTSYYALPFILGVNGIEYRFPLPDLTENEEKLIRHSVLQVYKDVKKGEKYFVMEDSCRLGDLVDCKEKGITIDKLFSELRGKKSNATGNLEYLLLTQKQNIQIPARHKPAKYPVPASLEEPFDNCYDGCNPLELPELPTERRKLPPSSCTEYSSCCYEEADPPVVTRRKQCESIGKCNFRPCNFPPAEDISSPSSSQATAGTICRAQCNNIQAAKPHQQNHTECDHDETANDIHLQPLTEHSKLADNECSLLEPKKQFSHSKKPPSSTSSHLKSSVQQEHLQNEPDTDLPATHSPDSKPTSSCTFSHLKSSVQQEHLQNEPHTDLPIATQSPDSSLSTCFESCQNPKKDSSNPGQKKPKSKTPKDPPSSQSSETSSSCAQDSSSNFTERAKQFLQLKMSKTTNQNLNKEKPEYLDSTEHLNDSLEKAINEISQDSLNVSEKSLVKNPLSNNNEKIALISSVKPQKMEANKNVMLSTRDLQVPSKTCKEQRAERKGTFRKVYNKLFGKTVELSTRQAGKKNASYYEKTLSKTESSTQKPPVNNSKGVRGSKQISIHPRQSDRTVPSREEYKAYKAPAKHEMQKLLYGEPSDNINSQLYAPKCPSKYLFGEYIAHEVEKENIAFDNVKEVKPTFQKHHVQATIGEEKNDQVRFRVPQRERSMMPNKLIKEESTTGTAGEKSNHETTNLKVFKPVDNISLSNNKSIKSNKPKINELKEKIEMKFKKSPKKDNIKNVFIKERHSVIPLTSPNSNDFKFSLIGIEHIKKMNSIKSVDGRHSLNRDPKSMNPHNVRRIE